MESLKAHQPGEPYKGPSAKFHRAAIDAIRQVRQWQQGARGEPTPDTAESAIVSIRNDSGATRNRYEVLGIDGSVVTPAGNLLGFQNGSALVGATPTASDHTGQIAILLEPIPDEAFGRACVLGRTRVQVDVSDADHRYADVKDGDATCLESCESGTARILYKPSGTGLLWADVVLQGGFRRCYGQLLRYGATPQVLSGASAWDLVTWGGTGSCDGLAANPGLPASPTGLLVTTPGLYRVTIWGEIGIAAGIGGNHQIGIAGKTVGVAPYTRNGLTHTHEGSLGIAAMTDFRVLRNGDEVEAYAMSASVLTSTLYDGELLLERVSWSSYTF